MMQFTLAAVPFVMKIAVGLWALIAVVLILVVLIQKGRGGGLASAFGGLGGSLLGTKTGDFLTWVTICLVAVWLLLSVVTVKFFKPTTSQYLQPTPVQQSVPSTPTAPVPPTQTQENTAQPVAQPNTPANQ
jgi:preprotein translocase subunit SecG